MVQRCLQSGAATQAIIDAKVLHLLSAYEKAGLFSVPMADSSCKAGTAEHREVALQAALASVVLLKNEHEVLPLPKQARLCIGGSLIGKASQGGGSSMVDLPDDVPSLASALKEMADVLPRFWYRNPKWRQRVAGLMPWYCRSDSTISRRVKRTTRAGSCFPMTGSQFSKLHN
jgi:beta-glucosidase